MNISMSYVIALSVLSLLLSGCYVIPMDSQGNPVYPGYAVPAGSPPSNRGPGPVSLPARLYPDNALATETGVVTGVVTNMMTGKGRFNLNYMGSTLTGEATRISGDDRRGVASAYSPNGAYMSCEYQMNNPRQGAGTCTFSSGAKYRLHIGN